MSLDSSCSSDPGCSTRVLERNSLVPKRRISSSKTFRFSKSSE